MPCIRSKPTKSHDKTNPPSRLKKMRPTPESMGRKFNREETFAQESPSCTSLGSQLASALGFCRQKEPQSAFRSLTPTGEQAAGCGESLHTIISSACHLRSVGSQDFVKRLCLSGHRADDRLDRLQVLQSVDLMIVKASGPLPRIA